MNARNLIDQISESRWTFLPMDPDEFDKVLRLAGRPVAGLDTLFLVNKDITGYHGLRTEVSPDYMRLKVSHGLDTGEVNDEFFGFGRLALYGIPSAGEDYAGKYLMVLKSEDGWIMCTSRGGNHGLTFIDDAPNPNLDSAIEVFLTRLGVKTPQSGS